MIATAHPGRRGLDIGRWRAELQNPPAPTPLTEIEPRAAAPADPAAIQLMPRRPSRHNHFPLIAEVHAFDDRRAQIKQPRPYPCRAHVVMASWIPAFEKPEPSQPGGVRTASAAHLTHDKSTSAGKVGGLPRR